ncbi:MAG: TRAP transporter TatT component family protein [Myxococcota bacterium]|nr:TRAP transporter TatT component family protein [Myxococcota bacterium]
MALKIRRCFIFVLLTGLLAFQGGCVKQMAINALGDALAGNGSGFGSDDDPELVRDASAFGLKTIEGLIVSAPEHEGLLLAATSGFTQYAFAFIQMEADYLEARDSAEARRLRLRAYRMYKRARRYGLRAMGLIIEDPLEALRADSAEALSHFQMEHAAILYWTAAAWAAAVSLNKDDSALAVDLDLVEAMMKRVAEVSPGYGGGAVHDFLVSWEAGRPAAAGGSIERAKVHHAAAIAASKGQRIAPLVSYAEVICVREEDKACFRKKLRAALDFDLESAPEQRLVNLISRRRAAWLLTQEEELFF